VVGVTGVEPVTLRLSSACSNQLSYTPFKAQSGGCGPMVCRILSCLPFPTVNSSLKMVELRRFELLTYSLQSYRSTN
jgi:hypothetical protein